MKSLLNDAFFSRLEALSTEYRTSLAGFFGGKHRTRTYGQTVEFADYREYMLGDDIRRIDWNLYSRFEKFFLKLFTDERQMHIQFFIDCSASMGKVNPDKSNYAISIAAALGFLSIHNMDKVSFKLIKNNIAEDLCGTIVGKKTFFNAVSDLERTEFSGSTQLAHAITNCPNTGHNDGLTVIISDFLSDENDWKKAVDFLTFRRRQVLLIQILSPEELDPTYDGRMHLIDSESEELADPRNMKIRITPSLQKAYEQAIFDITDDLKTFCRSREADYFCVSSDTDIEKVLFGELMKIGMIV